MLEALKSSLEDKELVDAAVKYLRGVKGTLVQQKKRDKEKAALAKAQPIPPPGYIGSGYLPNNTYPQPPNTTNGCGSNVSPSHGFPGPPGAQISHRGGVGQGQGMHAQQQQQQMIQQMHGQGYNDQQVETALRGFLGSD